VTHAQETGWDVCVIATPDGMKFLDAARLADLTGYPVRSQYKQPDEPDVLPPADAVIVAPATFNTINKWAHGISDTLALGLLNEATGLRLPIVAAPWLGPGLLHHPALRASIDSLRQWGVRIILDWNHPAQPGGSSVFPWDQVRSQLGELYQAVTGAQQT
jgi:phosphopantothenoylcysteine synthetase/decarboxylase